MVPIICSKCKRTMDYIDDEENYPQFRCKPCKREISMSKALAILEALDKEPGVTLSIEA